MPPDPRQVQLSDKLARSKEIAGSESPKPGPLADKPINHVSGSISSDSYGPSGKGYSQQEGNYRNVNYGQGGMASSGYGMSGYGSGMSGYGMSGYGMGGYGMGGGGYGGMMGGYGGMMGGYGMPNNGLSNMIGALYGVNHILMSVGQLIQIIGGNSQNILMQIEKLRQFVHDVCIALRSPAIERWIKRHISRSKMLRWVLVVLSMTITSQIMRLFRSFMTRSTEPSLLLPPSSLFSAGSDMLSIPASNVMNGYNDNNSAWLENT
eukprot:gene13622-28924_t